MFPLNLLDDGPDEEGRTPPPLFTTIGVGHTEKEWLATYTFYLGALDGGFVAVLGPRSTMTEEEAVRLASSKTAPQRAHAYRALLTALNLETMH